ncbi:rhodanese-like domain-containing protein [Luteolibacter soli]|uniref:Rhodanese-like domain-containing protein n=1 Tax=Luteolibacter soli TaxID=3135280 RepID=A0ABU9AU28_9BACT
MKTSFLYVLTAGLAFAAEPPNPKIDFDRFRAISLEVAKLRETRRISEDDFLRLAAEPGTVVLDARSREKYDQLHIKGAVHLNLSDFSEVALKEVIPAKDTRVLIYCNNNFEGEERFFVSKAAPAALNIPTFISLHSYGYTNVHELGPLLDIKTTKIPFAGKSVK